MDGAEQIAWQVPPRAERRETASRCRTHRPLQTGRPATPKPPANTPTAANGAKQQRLRTALSQSSKLCSPRADSPDSPRSRQDDDQIDGRSHQRVWHLQARLLCCTGWIQNNVNRHPIAGRFRGFLPVVVDVETGGFDPQRHALLEIAAVVIRMEADGWLKPGPTLACHVLPFIGAEMDPRALAFNKIDPEHPFRDAVAEQDALNRILTPIRKAVSTSGCNRAILVGHNAHFDLGFVKAAVERTNYKRNPFHAFSVFDTVSLAGLVVRSDRSGQSRASGGTGLGRLRRPLGDLRCRTDCRVVLHHRQPMAHARSEQRLPRLGCLMTARAPETARGPTGRYTTVCLERRDLSGVRPAPA